MVSILIDAPEDEREFVMAALMDAGTLGCSEEAAGLRAFFAERGAIEGLAFAYPVIEVRDEAPVGVSAEAELGADPVPVGARFFVATPGCAEATPEGRMRLVVQAGPAFGTGRHESTQMMLEVMERLVRPGMTVVDVGCGSGILSQAALLLGAGRVVACDVDPVFLQAIPEELRRRVFVGSADALRTGEADLVLGNISAKVIDGIAYDLQRIGRRDGWLVVSGFIRERTPQEVRPAEELQSGDWLCWICRPAAVDLARPAAGVVHSLAWY